MDTKNYIAHKIGQAMQKLEKEFKGEFRRIRIITWHQPEVTICYPTFKTDLMWHPESGEAKIVYEGDAKDIQFLSASVAWSIDPIKHERIKNVFVEESKKHSAFMMPNPELAEIIRFHPNWEKLFYAEDHDGVDIDLIVNATKIIMEDFDLNDNPINHRIVYFLNTGIVSLEKPNSFLHNIHQQVF